MPINWEVYDLLDEFSVFDAACLWLEIEPTRNIVKDMPGNIINMIRVIEQKAGGRHTTFAAYRAPTSFREGVNYGPIPVSRSALMKMAEILDKKPKFLFPESRNENLKPVEKSLSTKERETALKLIIGMAIKGYRYDPSAKRSDKPREIAEDLESLGIGLDPDTVRKWLHEAAGLLPKNP